MFRPKKCRDGLIIRPEKCMFAGDPNMVSFTVTESFLLAGINQGGNHLVVGFIDGGEIEILVGAVPDLLDRSDLKNIHRVSHYFPQMGQFPEIVRIHRIVDP